MDDLINMIKESVAANANADVRQQGAVACRTILTALEAVPGETTTSSAIGSQLAMLVTAMRGMPTEQFFDLAIAKLRAMLPPGAAIGLVKPLAFPMILTQGVQP